MSDAAEQTLGQALKKIFSTPTPTPHRKKKSATAIKKKSPTPTPTPSPKKKHSPPPKEEESPTSSPTSSPKKKRTPAVEEETPTPTPTKKKISPTASPTASAHHKKKGSPTPEPFETPEGSTSPAPSPQESAPPPPSPAPSRKLHAPNATLLPNQIKGFENYPLKVQKLLTAALELTTRDLDYKYGSADPTSGGMDCSGFVYYVLKQNDVADVPRDSSQQYVWLRRARTFEAVMSQKDDSFELQDLKPGDLLFWTGTYSIERDPPITHAMIYLGREKKTGNRVMVGASDGRVYQGESRFGVSVFDFKVQHRETNGEGKLRPTFIGYGHIPGLRE
ncbi:MAG TPA: NlpC/P60 family protein [Chthoniobacterales bacterium]|nr:NlpC/P60 family protein [Chthoniobacterales bacterium]